MRGGAAPAAADARALVPAPASSRMAHHLLLWRSLPAGALTAALTQQVSAQHGLRQFVPSLHRSWQQELQPLRGLRQLVLAHAGSSSSSSRSAEPTAAAEQVQPAASSSSSSSSSAPAAGLVREEALRPVFGGPPRGRPPNSPTPLQVPLMPQRGRPSTQQLDDPATTSSSSSSTSLLPGSSASDQSAAGSAGSGQRGHLWSEITEAHLRTIRDHGLEALPGWSSWGDAQLLQQWTEARAQLPAALQELAGVSHSGPVRLVCFDLETTKGAHVNDVVELGAVTDEGEAFTSLVAPLTAISFGAQASHGLGWEHVRDAPPLAAVLLQWVRWLTQQCAAAPGGSSTLVLCGHNVLGFDCPILDHWLEALGQPQVQLRPRKGKRRPALTWPVIDTCNDAQFKDHPSLKAIYARTGSRALQTWREAFGIPANRAHRALDDVMVNLEVFGHMAQRVCPDAAGSSTSQLAAELLVARQTRSSTAQFAANLVGARQTGSSTVQLASKLLGGSDPSIVRQPPPPPQTQQRLQVQQQEPPPPPPQQQGEAAQPLQQGTPQTDAVPAPEQQPPPPPVRTQQAVAAAAAVAGPASPQDVRRDYAYFEDDLRRQYPDLPPDRIEYAAQILADAQAAKAEAEAAAKAVAPAALPASGAAAPVSGLLQVTGASSAAPGVQPHSSSTSASSSSNGSTSASSGSGCSKPPSAPSPGAASTLDGWSDSSSTLGPISSEEVDTAVEAAVNSLNASDLRFDTQELATAWPPFNTPLAQTDAKLTATQLAKLQGAGFATALQVLLYPPRVSEAARGIRAGGSGGISLDASLDEGGDSGGEQGKHLVDILARCVATVAPRPTKTSAFWMGVFEAPTDPPSVGPVGLKIMFFQPGKTAQWAMAQAGTEHAKARAALEAGTHVRLQGFVKQAAGPYAHPAHPEPPCTWEMAPKRIDWDAKAPAEQSEGESLIATYKKCKDLEHSDLAGDKRGAGIVNKLLALAAKVAGDGGDLLPKARSRYSLMGWEDTLHALHAPSSRPQYQRACKSCAFQELVLLQVAQLLERYRLTSIVQDAQQALAEAPPEQQQKQRCVPAPQAAATAPRVKRQPKQPAAATGSGGRGSSSSSRRASEARGAPAAGADGGLTSPGSGSVSDDEQASSAAPSPPSGPPPAPALSGDGAVSEALVTGIVGATPAHSITARAAVAAAQAELPFTLTKGQQEVLDTVLQDMRGPKAMLRLLQGDVGCGKTIVALLACLAAADSGYQALLFAPTELLAKQHMATLTGIIETLPLALRPRTGLLLGSASAREKKLLKAEVADGKRDILISTQAALWVQEWKKLALVVIDEQHKLGTAQRERLCSSVAAPPHTLLMSATPIPRTLALTTYGSLTLSTINELPPGRTPVETHVVPDEDTPRQEMYAAMSAEIASGGRAYIVCPLVKAAAELTDEGGSEEGVRAVDAEYARLSTSGVFGAGVRVGKLHGKMSAEDKAEVLDSFASGETQVLIASTVVEVGVDVPEASIMLVEGAWCFGLAQLHQLRGRVGRGARASRCYVVAPARDAKDAAQATERLEVLQRSHSGLEIAESDLRLRGFGDLWSGTKQSGRSSLLSPITMSELQADPKLIEHARLVAAQLISQRQLTPALKAALLAYGLMTVQEGSSAPQLRDGVSCA